VLDLVDPVEPDGRAARVGMQGGMYPMGRGDMCQKYRLACLGGNGHIAAAGGLCELRTMARATSESSNDVTIYLVEEDFGQHGRAYAETDTAEADRESIIRNFLSG
jgi:hypothetical protein